MIAVLRASRVSALAPVCDVLVEEGILSLELTLTTPGLLDSLPELINRYADAADVGRAPSALSQRHDERWTAARTTSSP